MCSWYHRVLRWTLREAIQPHVDVYLTKETMESVTSAFPYLVDKNKASGGGDVAGIRFHIMEKMQNQGDLLESLSLQEAPYALQDIGGVSVQPFEGTFSGSLIIP